MSSFASVEPEHVLTWEGCGRDMVVGVSLFVSGGFVTVVRGFCTPMRFLYLLSPHPIKCFPRVFHLTMLEYMYTE